MHVPDPRHISNGRQIATEGYCDQPYVVVNEDGSWTCVMTTGAGREGQGGQHVVSIRSKDRGESWSEPVDIEPADGPEASWALPFKAATGRIYAFYCYNAENLRRVVSDDEHYAERVDSLGEYAFKFSDDGGRTWPGRRYYIPAREMRIDRDNPYGGKVRFFWGVGKPTVVDGAMIFGFAKMRAFGHGFMAFDQSCFIRSDNILTETDPDKLRWETLPEGDEGLKVPGGPVADEAYPVVLSDGSLYCTYRTVDGHPCHAYSRDGGRNWTGPAYMTYADGRLVKHPRAANFAWRLSNGKYLYWFHNHGGTWYEDRNPVWVSGGVERDGPDGKELNWSQPEILLYDDDTRVRMSYPDLVEQDGRVYVTETQKAVARVHAIDAELLQGLWGQFDNAEIATRGLVLSLPEEGRPMPVQVKMPGLPEFSRRIVEHLPTGSRPGCHSEDLRTGISIEVWLRLESLEAGQVIVDSRTPMGRGLCLPTTDRGTVEIVLNDGRAESRWDCDPGVLEPGKMHHLAAIVDGGPKIISFVVDGKLCDGGESRQFGWGRYNPNLCDVNGAGSLRIAPGLNGRVEALRVYDRYLRTSEAVSNFRAGLS